MAKALRNALIADSETGGEVLDEPMWDDNVICSLPRPEEVLIWAEHRLASGMGLLEEPPSSGVGSPPFMGGWSFELCEERLYLLGLAATDSSAGRGLAANDLVQGGFSEVVQIIARLGEFLGDEVRGMFHCIRSFKHGG